MSEEGVMRNPEEIIKEWFESIKRDNPDLLINDFYKYLVPIYKFEENDYDFCGTGFFCKLKSRIYFVTCNHVVHECINNSKSPGVYVIYDGHMNNMLKIVPQSNLFESIGGGRENDNVDIFVCQIESNEIILKIASCYNFFYENDFDLGVPSIHMPRELCAFGFPYTRNKVEWRDSFWKYDLYTYSGKELNWNEYESYEYKLSNHVVFRCNWKESQKPDPHGISGGCIFNISENRKTCMLAGMTFEMKEKEGLIAGLNIQAIHATLKYIDSNNEIK